MPPDPGPLLLRVVATSMAAIGIAFGVLVLFWRSLRHESDREETKVSNRTLWTLAALILVLVVTAVGMAVWF